jgi:RNA polymerase sigma-70 factor (TIGR02943 family)
MQTKNVTTASSSTHIVDPHKWVANHADYLYSYAISRLNDEDVARDLVQDTFLAALERVNSFEGRSTERTWLTAILKFKIIDIYRGKAAGLANARNNGATGIEPIDFFDEADGHWKEIHRPQEFAHSADSPLLSREFQNTLQSCMDKLPALWLAIFTMKHMDDIATKIICSELKVTAANFWVIIHRTKLNLRACLQKNWI